jgi:hypothetical protein
MSTRKHRFLVDGWLFYRRLVAWRSSSSE